MLKKLKHIIKPQLWLIYLLILIFIPITAKAVSNASLSGKILLQVEANGEAWYIYPKTEKRHYLGRPDDAFRVMRELSLGAKSEIIAQTIFPARLAGFILLDVEKNGEAYYIHPQTLRKHYLGRPSDAFRIMREFGLGITNSRLSQIPIDDINEEEKDTVSTITSSYIKNVPFTSQAPYGNWSDSRQQDGCEEASALMAIKWVRGESLTKDEALREITGISDYIKNKYGEYRDVSSQDAVNWIYKDYFNYHKVEIRNNVLVNDIISELAKGNVVVAAMDGQKLFNPNFTAPGPERHMLLIKGYDKSKDVFITNDPGTRNGEDYEYTSKILFEALRDYPTGYHEAITSPGKNIIIIEK